MQGTHASYIKPRSYISYMQLIYCASVIALSLHYLTFLLLKSSLFVSNRGIFELDLSADFFYTFSDYWRNFLIQMRNAVKYNKIRS